MWKICGFLKNIIKKPLFYKGFLIIKTSGFNCLTGIEKWNKM